LATKTVKSPTTRSSKDNGVNAWQSDFVACELTTEQKAHCKNHVLALVDAFDSMDTLLHEGYKLSFRFEDKNSAMAVWLTAPTQDHANSGLLLQGRGPSVLAAITVVLYKHFELLKEDWSSAGKAGAKDVWG